MSEPVALLRLLAPRSVAIAGVSRQPGSIGHRCLSTLLKHRYPGAIYAVHPQAAEVAGVRCWPSVEGLPEDPDVVIALLPPEATIAAARAAAQRGAGWLIAGGAGFEADDVLALEDATRDAGIRVVGPNTEGLWDLSAAAVMSFGSVAYHDDLRDGAGAVISQSGGVGAAMARLVTASGLGCRTFVATGDELDLSLTEVLSHLVSRGDCSLIALYIEAVEELVELRDLIAEATAANTTVAVLKVGSSRAGAEAAASHSGRMSGRDDLYRSTIRAAGGIMVDSLAELDALARVLAVGRPQVRANLGVVAVSGGTRAMIADAIERAENLGLTRFAAVTQAELERILPRYGVADNPVDVTGAILHDASLLDACTRAVANDPGVDGILVQVGNTQVSGLPDWVATAQGPAADTRTWISTLHHPELGAPGAGRRPLPEPAAAIRALDALAAPAPASGARTIGIERGAPLDAPQTFLDAAELLGAVGIATPVSHPLNGAECETGLPSTPAVVKTANLAITHKVAQGGVVMDVANMVEARQGADRIRDRLGTLADPIIAQEMIPHGVELLIAVHESDGERFLVLGAGGSGVEEEGDIALCLLPTSREAVAVAVRTTRIGRRLSPAQMVAAIAAAEGLATLQLRLNAFEIEINPLVVIDDSPTALDFLISHERTSAA